jgi:predicted RNase H-like HicB family nuclease
MRYYVALIHKDADSAFGVSFPDFPGCVTAADTIEEAMERAADVLAFHVAGMREDGDKIPEPRTIEQTRKAGDDWVDFENATVAMVPLLERTGRPKAVNVSLDTGFLQSVDRYAEAIGSTRSAVLTEGGLLLMRSRPAASKVNPGRAAKSCRGDSGSNPVRRTKQVQPGDDFLFVKEAGRDKRFLRHSPAGRYNAGDAKQPTHEKRRPKK